MSKPFSFILDFDVFCFSLIIIKTKFKTKLKTKYLKTKIPSHMLPNLFLIVLKDCIKQSVEHSELPLDYLIEMLSALQDTLLNEQSFLHKRKIVI